MANSAFIDYAGNTRILFFDSVGFTAAASRRASSGRSPWRTTSSTGARS
jgi:hypothetical protein